MNHRLGLLGLVFGLVLALSACAPTAATANCQPGDIIESFVPDRGEGAIYRDNDKQRFSYTLACPGYVTLETTNGTVLYGQHFAHAGSNTLPPAAITMHIGLSAPFGKETMKLVYANTKGANPTITDEAETWFTSAP